MHKSQKHVKQTIIYLNKFELGLCVFKTFLIYLLRFFFNSDSVSHKKKLSEV